MIGLADLQGRWQLSRRVEDRRAGVTGRLEGTCVWRPDGTGLRQEESGLLRYGEGPAMRATRVYLWRQIAAGLEVLFEDGRPFHQLVDGRASDRHLCPPDTYGVRYDFGGWPHWTQHWHVSGPRKDAMITSRFTPG